MNDETESLEVATSSLDQGLKKEYQSFFVPAVNVDNVVIKINPHVSLPFNLRIDERAPIGFFAQSAFAPEAKTTDENQVQLESWPNHTRSALLGRIVFEDEGGNIYRDIDLKGMGALVHRKPLFKSARVEVVKPGKDIKEPSRTPSFGLLNETEALKDYSMAELLVKKNIRTNRILALIRLKELIVDDKRVSLEKAREDRVIKNNFIPVVEVRGFATKARVQDFTRAEIYLDRKSEDKYSKFGMSLIEDAKEVIRKELGLEKPLDNLEYLEWFAKTLGTNLALLHKEGLVHTQLHGQNITLDCRFVDLATMKKTRREGYRLSEYDLAKSVVWELARTLIGIETMKHKFGEFEIFDDSYDKVFSKIDRDKIFQ